MGHEMLLYKSLFTLSSLFALIGWILLICLPNWAFTQTATISIVVILLCGLYSYLVFLGKRHDDPQTKARGHFWSLDGVMRLFKSPRVVLAGWIHYLAFDLMVGVFILNDASQYNIAHWLLIPCLLLTLMFGPAGLLAYFVLRAAITGEFSFS